MFFLMNKREKALKLVEVALAPHVKAVELFDGRLDSSDFLDPYVLGYVVGQIQYATHAAYRGRANIEQKGMVALEVWRRLIQLDPKAANDKINQLTVERDADFELGIEQSAFVVDVMLGLRTAEEDPQVADALAEARVEELSGVSERQSKDGPAAASVLASQWIGERLRKMARMRGSDAPN